MDLVRTSDNTTVQFFAGDFPRVTKAITVVSGSGVLTKGTVLGKITASGKYKAYANGSSDGSEIARLILAEDVDATSEDVNCTAYASGHFNTAALTGLDAPAEADFDGTPIFTGTVI